MSMIDLESDTTNPDDIADDDVYGGVDSHLEMEYEDRNGCGYEADGFDY
jgi:hypothetical protein